MGKETGNSPSNFFRTRLTFVHRTNESFFSSSIFQTLTCFALLCFDAAKGQSRIKNETDTKILSKFLSSFFFKFFCSSFFFEMNLAFYSVFSHFVAQKKAGACMTGSIATLFNKPLLGPFWESSGLL